MRRSLVIEPFVQSGNMGVLQEILTQKDIGLVAVGSMACINSIENAAKELNATDRIYVKGLSAKEYALGKNSYFIRNLVEQALQNFQVKGVIVYCSCLEVLTNLYENDVLDNLENELNIPIEFLYRGPLVKRKLVPRLSLNAIWKKWGIVPKPVRVIQDYTDNYDCSVDFKEAIVKHKGRESIVLITPGGCSSCLKNIPNIENLKVFYTRFDDIFLSSVEPMQFVNALEEYFQKDEPLLLLGTAVVKVIGISLQEICDKLSQDGYSARCIETDGFAN